jgi:S-(hydroxymethyl)glutathione dehydrogenase/alcohol dehydrogenase
MKAVVVEQLNEYAVQEVEIDPPKAGEVKVKIKAAGVCHSDLSVINGTIPLANFGPVVLGHEGAGVISEVGEGVEGLQVGDHVALSWVYMCGECYFCDRDEHHLCQAGDQTLGKMLDGTSRIKRDGQELNTMMKTGCMAEEAIVPASSCVVIEKDIPFTVAAFVGCGVMTGVGAATKTAEVKPGSSVAVVGCGGIGLSIIQGARIAGAKMVIAVDQMQSKLDMALKFGATHAFLAEEAQDQVMALTGVGVDYGFEAVGIAPTVKTMDQLTRRGGTATVVGVGSLTNTFDFNAFAFSMTGKTYKGCYYGSAYPKVDFPTLLSFYKNGSLDLDNMISKTYKIEEIEQAFDDMQGGSNARGIIVFD